jgi:protein-tyrosine phosphatase
VTDPMRVCFVCSGNICRSPTAEVVLNHLARQSGVAERVVVSSAGMGNWHAGDDMDERSRALLSDAGYDVPTHTARQFRPADFAANDLVIALDAGHRAELTELARRAADPAAARAKIVLLRSYDPDLGPDEDADVADPYYGGRHGFETVLDQVERSCAGLLEAIAGDAAAVQQTESPPR